MRRINVAVFRERPLSLGPQNKPQQIHGEVPQRMRRNISADRQTACNTTPR